MDINFIKASLLKIMKLKRWLIKLIARSNSVRIRLLTAKNSPVLNSVWQVTRS